MTPTFHAIAMETTKPLAQRRLVDPLGFVERLNEYHFFDVSSVLDLARDLGNRFVRSLPIGKMAFLPARWTALDFGKTEWGRWGVLLQGDGERASGCLVTIENGVCRVSPGAFAFGLGDAATNKYGVTDNSAAGVNAAGYLVPLIYGALALINTPRTIGRRQHMPHAGLQRKLAAAHGMPGKFPLQAWTEIILEVRPPVIEGERVHEARLTGGKCLHFCRAHLRIRNGTLEYVSPHWRGNGALGIKQSRYDVRPPGAA